MPCGGILPVDLSVITMFSGDDECFYCFEDGADHFVEEWDCLIHARCVLPFLETEEGQVVLDHKHEVIVRYYEEG